MDAIAFFRKSWWVFALASIFLISYEIRSFNIIEDKILSYDPVFMYRYTKYFADYGTMPLWDELTYYTGRAVNGFYVQPLMHYITAAVHWTVGSAMDWTLKTTAAYMSAIYGALIAISAFLLGRELSNKYGGLMAALLVSTAPQILSRTFGSSYDSDQIVLFFIFLSLFAGLYMFRKKTVPSYCLALGCFTGFMMSWNMFWFTFAMLAAFFLVNIVISMVRPNEKFDFKIDSKRLKESVEKNKTIFLLLLALGLGILATGTLGKMTLEASLGYFIGFANKAEAWIVNISIAELQLVDLFSLSTWVMALGNFSTGTAAIDYSMFLIFLAFIASALYFAYKKSDNVHLSFMITLMVVSAFTLLKGVRFSEFTSGLFIVIVSAGFGYLMDFSFNKSDKMIRTIVLGTAVFVAIIALNIAIQYGQQLGPDTSSNWQSAWDFLRTKTPELSLVGTWWDPGHMITGLAERRVIADGAHCDSSCMYTINDRIVDLGKIMVTSDENVSLNLIRKYQGTSPSVYWIASSDLIGKFQWLQYFGTGCDARYESSCPLYMQLGMSSTSSDTEGNPMLFNYQMSSDTKVMLYNSQVPIPIYVQGINAVLFEEVIYYNGTMPEAVKFSDEEKSAIITALNPLERQLNVRFANQSISMSVWVPSDYSYIVIIPPTLRESVFTKMFMLEGQGLEHFRQVFRNEEVKIYEVV